MKNLLFLLALLPIMFACSSNENISDKTLLLSKNNLTIEYQGEDFIDILGVEASECNIAINDDYFAKINTVSNTVKIHSEKVGETSLIVKYKEQEKECKISVTPIIDYIGIPITAIGESMEYIKKREKTQLTGEDFQKLTYFDNNILFGANHYYNFEDNKLKYINTYIDISKLSGGTSFSLLKERAGASLDERYSFIQEYKGKHKNILIYTFKNKLYIGASLNGGNGGWNICYAKTLDEVKEISDVR